MLLILCSLLIHSIMHYIDLQGMKEGTMPRYELDTVFAADMVTACAGMSAQAVL